MRKKNNVAKIDAHTHKYTTIFGPMSPEKP